MHNLYSGFKFIAFLTLLSGLIACGDADETTNTVSIEFVSASPTSISIQGTGGAGLSETSVITFRVKDPDGVALEAQTVDFSLSTSVGGIKLSSENETSDLNGLVTTVVQSGAVPTAVRVIASIPGTTISILSDQLSITSGIPDQDSMTLGAVTLNPEGLETSGIESEIVIHMADIFNNFVPVGTSVSFTTEGGAIEGSCLTGSQSSCSVIWQSQAPRPAGGIVTIIATALGQESFIDVNSNGIFDTGDTFTDMPEAFRDDDDTGTYTSGEVFIDSNNDGVYSAGDALYNGSSCMPGFNMCSSQKNIHVRDSVRIVMSGSTATITGMPAAIDLTAQSPISFTVNVADINGNAMPKDTSISVSTNNGTINSETSFIVPNTRTSTSFNVSIEADDTSDTGLLTIEVTTPRDVVTLNSISVTD
jgi:hypothetical protein